MDVLGDVLIVAGAAWFVLAAIGVCRFDDVYARMHAATKSATLGLLLVLGGAAAHLGGWQAAKLLLAGLLLFITAPVGSHLVGRAVHRNTGDAPVRIDAMDELEEMERAERGE